MIPPTRAPGTGPAYGTIRWRCAGPDVRIGTAQGPRDLTSDAGSLIAGR
jgi:hypothetical protein